PPPISDLQRCLPSQEGMLDTVSGFQPRMRLMSSFQPAFRASSMALQRLFVSVELAPSAPEREDAASLPPPPPPPEPLAPPPIPRPPRTQSMKGLIHLL